MTPKTEEQLNALIEELQQKLEAAEACVQDAEERADRFERQLQSDDLGWSNPRRHELFADALPVPRLELHWTRDDEDGSSTRCTYMLVYSHFLDRGDNRHIVGVPLGQTKCQGASRPSFFRFTDSKTLDTPFRDSAHAYHDAEQFSLPLFITTIDEDIASVDVKTRDQTLLWVAGKRQP